MFVGVVNHPFQLKISTIKDGRRLNFRILTTPESLNVVQYRFYPKVFKDGAGIIITNGIQMGRLVGRRQAKVSLGCINKPVRCRK